MIMSLRRSFAAKLIVGGCVLALIVVGGVASYLIFSRAQQTRAAAQSNADNRVGVMAEVLNRFTGVQSLSAAAGLADQPALRAALASPSPRSAVPAIFAATTSVDLDGEVLLITDAKGSVVYNRNAPSLGAGTGLTVAPQAVRTALNDGQCARGGQAPISGGCGIELVSGQTPAYVVALPVVDSGTVVGVVAYVAPLAYQLTRFQALFNFPTAFIPQATPDREFRPALGTSASTDPGLRATLGQPSGSHRAIYDAPVTGSTLGSVAGSFVPVYGSAGNLTGYIGVEVPLSQFVGDERTDILVVALISVFLVLVVAFNVILFVERFVKRPIARLEGGVARIAGGDYATDIPVRSQDELGKLATNVNRMRDAIAGYVRQIEDARKRLDHSLEQVSGVSRALTTTTAGVPTLQQAVVRTAASIGGGPRSAVLAVREADTASLVAVAAEAEPPPLSDWPGLDAVLTGQTLRLAHPEHGSLVAVPMFYQDRVIGTLATVTPVSGGVPLDDTDVDVLEVLANNAAIAMENARLFEQERDTVRRLLELDSLKTDFLATVQHELRTPLTAILGLADLLEMCWDMWEEGPKLDAVRDIQVAAKNLYDIVETIIDFSVMEDEKLGLNPIAVPLRETIESTTALVGERYRGGLPVPIVVVGDASVTVFADPERLVQVLRAVLDNAVKFSDGRGQVTVTFAAVNRRREVRIEIADQGIGIPADDLPRVFDRFYQVDNTATRKYGGTGMGLALVSRMVDAHGARLEVASTVGEGTRFTLIWPASPAAASGEARAAADERPPSPPRKRSARPRVPVQ
ncbi:MAG: ATP-binding protein [Candidatus Dormibacteraeota bacterium]|nr:ATP-binding protein [Candidatus Dormibacteraeota bacterium]